MARGFGGEGRVLRLRVRGRCRTCAPLARRDIDYRGMDSRDIDYRGMDCIRERGMREDEHEHEHERMSEGVCVHMTCIVHARRGLHVRPQVRLLLAEMTNAIRGGPHHQMFKVRCLV